MSGTRVWVSTPCHCGFSLRVLQMMCLFCGGLVPYTGLFPCCHSSKDRLWTPKTLHRRNGYRGWMDGRAPTGTSVCIFSFTYSILLVWDISDRWEWRVGWCLSTGAAIYVPPQSNQELGASFKEPTASSVQWPWDSNQQPADHGHRVWACWVTHSASGWT